jgi:TolA-binding protein
LVEEIGDRDARIGKLEGQVLTLESTVGEHEARIEFLEEQIHDLNIDSEDANGHIDIHHAQQVALHIPPNMMDIDSDEEPEEIEGVSDFDYDVVASQPALMGVSTILTTTRRRLWSTLVYTPLSVA